MSVLAVGISHRTAPVDLLEQVALDADGLAKLLADVAGCEHVTEAAVLATCNRVEVYADVERFHGSVEEISRLLCRGADQAAEQLVPHLFVHYDDAAVAHLLQVVSGLDSMVVGEGQILGQVRGALRVAQDAGTIGPSLNVLFQQALRVGKRVHAETDIDHAAPSLVSAALDRVVEEIGPLVGRRAVVVGAGAMAGLAATTLARLGAGDIAVVNRTIGNAKRLAEAHAARTVTLADLPAEIALADLVICCTGAFGTVLSVADVAAARAHAIAPLAVVDLALPHDVEPGVGDLPGVTLIGLSRLALELADHPAGRDVQAVRAIVADEIASFGAARQQASVTPTLVALRSMATGVVDAEMARLSGRVPELDAAVRREVEQTVRRVAEKLLHQPTVRVKELADRPDAVSYAAALRELFALDPDAVDAVTRPEPVELLRRPRPRERP